MFTKRQVLRISVALFLLITLSISLLACNKVPSKTSPLDSQTETEQIMENNKTILSNNLSLNEGIIDSAVNIIASCKIGEVNKLEILTENDRIYVISIINQTEETFIMSIDKKYGVGLVRKDSLTGDVIWGNID